MNTDPKNNSSQYQALCGILARLDLTKPDSSVILKPETLALINDFNERDWELFVRMAKAEGVAPLMYYAMNYSAFQAPETIRVKLQAAYYETAAYNQLILAKMDQVVQVLHEGKIPLIVLKGALLARTIYPDAALRPMTDLDLLTPAHFVGKALKCVRDLGYELQKITNHAVLQANSKPAISIELHWTLAGQHRLSNKEMAKIITNLASEPVSSASHRSFDLLYLCAHMELQHTANRLIWLYDVIAFLRHYEKDIEWEELRSKGEQFEWIQALFNVLDNIKEHLDDPLPDNVRTGFSIDKESIRMHSREPEATRHSIQKAFNALGFSDRLMMLIYFLFPAPGYLRRRYKKNTLQQLPFLYFYRWVDLIRGGS